MEDFMFNKRGQAIADKFVACDANVRGFFNLPNTGVMEVPKYHIKIQKSKRTNDQIREDQARFEASLKKRKTQNEKAKPKN